MIIKAIETAYKGYRFRSRLEARWAVFFDEMGIDWIYEPEGYTDGDVCYLPDFYLSQVDMYAEAKPTPLVDKEIDKAYMLVKLTGCPVLMLVGNPDFVNYDGITPDWDGEGNGYFDIVDFSLVSFYLLQNRFPGGNYIPDGSVHQYGIDYRLAVLASRAARFEHGETP